MEGSGGVGEGELENDFTVYINHRGIGDTAKLGTWTRFG